MKPIRMNRRERILCALMTLSLVIGFYRIGIKTQANKISGLHAQMATAQEAIKRKNEIISDLHKESVATLNARGSDQVYLNYLQQNQYLSNLLDNLGANTPEHQIQLKSIDVQSHDKANGMNRSRFKLQIESSFVSLGQFLEKLAEKPLLLEVKSVELDRIDGDLKRCQATIEVDGYYKGGPS